MGLRFLTGTILCHSLQGDVTVTFNEHSVAGDDGRGIKMFEHGSEGDFRRRPSQMVGLSQAEWWEPISLPNYWGTSASLSWDPIRISESDFTTDHMVVSWEGVKRISYVVVGEVLE